MKTQIGCGVIAAIALSAIPAGAQDYPIIVAPQHDLTDWVDSVSAALDDRLDHGFGRGARAVLTDNPEGIVKVRFRLDAGGSPTDVQLFQASRSRTLNRAALRAVSSLDDLAARPAMLDDGTIYQANIIGATSPAAYDRLARRLADEEEMRLSSPGYDSHVFALNVTVRQPG